MSDEIDRQATPHHRLISQLFDPNVAKNECEWAAMREIDRLLRGPHAPTRFDTCDDQMCRNPECVSRQRDELRERCEKMRELVDAQAEDDGLWFVAQTAPEAYLQQALRDLHATVELVTPKDALAEKEGT